jgi:hypothetical protein
MKQVGKIRDKGGKVKSRDRARTQPYSKRRQAGWGMPNFEYYECEVLVYEVKCL